jgi:hypothetical protein
VQRIVHSPEDQVDVLEILSSHVLKADVFIKTLLPVVHTLYDHDVLDESVIVKWYSKQHGGKVKDALGPFVTWLMEAEEESSEEEDDG